MRLRVFLAVLMVVAPACSGDDDNVEPDSSSSSSSTTAVVSVDRPTDPAVGVARVAIGDDVVVDLAVAGCQTAAPDADGPPAQTLVDLVATGTLAGEPVRLAVRRFVSTSQDAVTFTDTVTLVVGPDDAVVDAFQAQRYEVDGVLTDTRDLDARGALIRLADDVVEVEGVFGPPGSFAGEPGLLPGWIVARCG